MAKVIAQRELRNDNASVVDAVIAGEEFIVTRNGTPVVELRPVRRSKRSFVARADLPVAGRVGAQIDGVLFRKDADRVIDEQLAPSGDER